MSRIPGTRFLHSPGPTHLPDEVLDAMHRQPMDLADSRVDDVIHDCEVGLIRVLRAEKTGTATMFASNAHGGWEAVIENLLKPGESALVPATGHFSIGWAAQTESLGRVAVNTEMREGYPIDPNVVADALRADTESKIGAVFVVHTDTASGVTSDIPAIRAAIDATGHRAILAVDVVASLAAAPFEFDDWNVDVAIGGSQKGLMTPPGLAFVAANEKARAKFSDNPAKRWYWDWDRRQSDVNYMKFAGTPPEHMLFGLQAAFKLIEQEGLAAIHARHQQLTGVVHAAIEGWKGGGAIDFFAKDPAARSVSVTPVQATGFDPEALRTVAREQFQVAMAGGNGPTMGRAFRIGHLGDMNVAMILGCLAGVEAAMHVQKIPIGESGVARAVRWLAEVSAS